MRPLLIVALLAGLGCAAPEPLPDYGAVPGFELTERSGRTVSSHDFDGKVWVADFVFTTCAGPCPRMSANMKRLQAALPDSPDVRLATFSVDPERDTPEILAEYAKRYGADPERWLFLTGDKQALYDLIRKGFLQAVDDGSLTEGGKPGPGIITHSTRYTLVDRHGRVRGFYHGEEAGVVQAILPDLERLLRED
ncbi:MAG: SCO family protein [Acidobacteria bacterium]|nr:SCO family protein [Acidobacteriota bacterium]